MRKKGREEERKIIAIVPHQLGCIILSEEKKEWSSKIHQEKGFNR